MKKKARMVLVFLGLLLVLACVSLTRASQGEEYVAAAGAQSLYRLDIAQSRGTIYDCNLYPLTGSGSQYVAAVAPTIQAIGALEKATDGEYRDQLALALENGKPFQLALDEPVVDDQIDLFQVPQRYEEDQLAPHIVGYLDSLGGGAAGVELAMNDALRRYEGEASVTYRVDALGRTIAGEERQVTNTLSRSQGGVALTLDSAVQALAEEAAAGLGKGAVVVTEVPDCQIRAVASVPDFSPLDLGEASESEDSPLVNRAFSAYAPGSVFKLVTAAALLEEGGYACTIENRIDEKIANDEMIAGAQLILGAFCLLLAAIGLANVFLNTRGFVHQRRREFARYLSLGMTPAELRSLFWIEGAVVAGRPLVVTLPLTAAVVAFMLDASHLEAVIFLAQAPVLPVALFAALIVGTVALAYGLGARELLTGDLTAVLKDDSLR